MPNDITTRLTTRLANVRASLASLAGAVPEDAWSLIREQLGVLSGVAEEVEHIESVNHAQGVEASGQR